MIARSTELHHHEQDVLRGDSMAHYFDYSSVAGTTYMALKHPIRHVLCLLLLSILWLPTIIADATPTSSPRYTAPTAPHGPTDPDEVKAFVDAFFTDQMQERHIPGAV